MTTLDALSAPDKTLARSVRRRFRGPVIRPSDPGYDERRRVWNARIDRNPALIARCSGTADVIEAVRLARESGLPISIRSSGHNITGCAVRDGGLMVDLSLMKGIRVDPQRRRVWAQSGANWGDLDHETQAFGLATTGGRISTVGIAGLTLGGGYGWLMRKLGLTIDNLRSVDLVTAEGRLLTVNQVQNRDLYWGIRGGGGNFGIVTSFEYDLHPIGPTVTGGWIYYDARHASKLLRFYREYMAAARDDLSTLFNFLSAPPPAPFVPARLRNAPVVAIAACHAGTLEAAEHDLAPLREIEEPLIDLIKPRPYTQMQRLFDAAGSFGNCVHSKSGHLPNLDDAVIETLLAHAGGITSRLSIVMISSLGGAVARVEEDATAFSHRRTAFDYAIDSVWTDPGELERHVQWTDTFGQAMRPHTTGAYVNEMDDQGVEGARQAYNPRTYARLAALKGRYDPHNLFQPHPNIPPARTSKEESWRPRLKS